MTGLPLRKQLAGLVLWAGISFIAAGIGAVATIDAPGFYAQLDRPAWAPPARVFGPVWTVLYALMGVAAWLVWRTGGLAAARGALTLFLIQLALNALWSWLFFAWHLGAASFADIVLLWGFIIATTIAFWRNSIPAGALLLPYLLWVSFALVLNLAVWRMNPALLG
jgi:benzodiazapine receptor